CCPDIVPRTMGLASGDRGAAMAPARDIFDLVIIGGGIAGNAVAAVMARAGRTVLVLERSTAYRDRVRGEAIHAWGVAEAQRLGLHEAVVGGGGRHAGGGGAAQQRVGPHEALLAAGGTHHRRFVPYDETVTPAEAMAGSIALDRVPPGVARVLWRGHPHERDGE